MQDQLIRGLNDPDRLSELLVNVTVNRRLQEMTEFVERRMKSETLRGSSKRRE